MNYILDTNIPILMVKNSKFSTFFKDVFSEDSAHTFSICIVSLGEIDSIVRQNQWGSKKAKQIIEILSKAEVINLDNKEIISAYGTLDAYSQGKLKDKPLPVGMSARNMGKNDLWIAASAMIAQGTLITTDKDFNHLHETLIKVDYIDIKEFQ